MLISRFAGYKNRDSIESYSASSSGPSEAATEMDCWIHEPWERSEGLFPTKYRVQVVVSEV